MTLKGQGCHTPEKNSAGDGQKVFAFTDATVNGRFDADLAGSFKEIIRRMHHNGYGLLPLNPSAMGMARSIDLPYHLMEDWLDAPAIVGSKEAAEAMEHQWYLPAGSGFCSDGVLWPLFDDDAMYWFWREVTYADAFVQSFLANGGQRFAYLMNRSLRPSLYYYDSDINGALWQSLMGSRAQPFTLDLQPNLEGFRPHAIAFGGTPGGLPRQPLEALAGRIVFALNHGEIHRFLPVIQRLKQRFPDGVALAILNHADREAVQQASGLSIPFVLPNFVPAGDDRLAGRFLDAFQAALTASTGKPWARPLEALKFHFQYYCRYRWPALAPEFQGMAEPVGKTPANGGHRQFPA